MLITLYAYRTRFSSYNQITTIKDIDGKVKAIFSSMLRQPKFGSKTIVINSNSFNLDWRNVIPSK
jgi:hypothetical protein